MTTLERLQLQRADEQVGKIHSLGPFEQRAKRRHYRCRWTESVCTTMIAGYNKSGLCELHCRRMSQRRYAARMGGK